jgi:hypothetical protein
LFGHNGAIIRNIPNVGYWQLLSSYTNTLIYWQHLPQNINQVYCSNLVIEIFSKTPTKQIPKQLK